MSSLAFRKRLLVILALFALVPTIAVTLLWSGSLRTVLPMIGASAAWDSVAASGDKVIEAARRQPLSPTEDSALSAHAQHLTTSLTQAKRLNYLAEHALPIVAVLSIVLLALLALLVSRVAGHLSRQLSRPVDELVGWTDLIARHEPLPDEPPAKGAPEFESLRGSMRAMAAELSQGRDRLVEQERLRAFRESARQVAHELKNPLTPIRFAVARLKREAPASLQDAIEVLATESERLDTLARNFAQFGRLPDGPASEVDVAELARYTARATVPEAMLRGVEVAPDAPAMVRGQYDALSRALSNVLLNAVDACRAGAGGIAVRVERGNGELGGRAAVRLVVSDTGSGIAPEKLAHIWDPYVTSKPGGTGLGLAIARQAVLAHGGTVRATSAPGAGTEITFVLPVDGPAGERMPQ
ncbi:MAG: HAMP domain-containing histidine kinase [Gemmatimonadetes bacterium]|nr:HAMP domain-containing histidine kinase [Gemmatimonadota bacterium]